jgi:hypothetical protein
VVHLKRFDMSIYSVENVGDYSTDYSYMTEFKKEY